MMNAARHRQLMQGQSAIAKKVFEALPLSDAWSPHEISREMTRLGHTPPTADVLMGCLSALHSAGLIKKIGLGTFCRERIKESDFPKLAAAIPIHKDPIMAAPTPSAAPITPIDVLSPIADRLRECVEQHRAALTLFENLANDIDNAAANLEEQTTASTQEITQLRQLKALLNTLRN